LAISKVFIPIGAGLTSAIGLLVAGLSFDFSRSSMTTLGSEILEPVNRMFAQMVMKGKEMIENAKAAGERSFFRTADMRYVGQGEHFTVPIPEGTLEERDVEKIKTRFNDLYHDIFGYNDESQSIEIVNWRLRVYCPPPPVKLKKYNHMNFDLDQAIKGKRRVFFPEAKGFVDCTIYDRYKLFQGAVIEGPAIVEERESTAVILPGDCARADEYCNLIVEIGE
ncbi:MAG: hypothetical protein V3W19_14775, partial [Desulfatiglandales bacterium]